MIAHELSPTIGSECSVGWNIVTRLAQFHNITVLFANGSQHGNDNSYINSVNDYLATKGEIKGLTFINIEQPAITKFFASLNKKFEKLGPTGLPMLYYWGYKFWHKAAYAKSKKLHKIEHFDIVHQLTQISFREPGFCWKLNVPFVWGPTGGTSLLPKEFYKTLPYQFKILEKIRTYSNIYHFRFTSRIKNANKKASIIYSFSNQDALVLSKRTIGEVKIMTESGTYNHLNQAQNLNHDDSVYRAIWIGRLTDYKAPEILLKAISSSNLAGHKIKFTIIGEGPLEDSLMKMARELNLDNIEWIKKVNHKVVFELMKNSDFLLHTSLREGTPNVVVEALSMGLPVICHDAYGMSIAINDTCGIKVPFVSPEKSIRSFYQALERIVTQTNLLNELKRGALKRASEISWDKKAELISNDYIAIIKKKSETGN